MAVTVTAPAILLARHAPAWQAATHHPFLDGVREGTLPRAAFRSWLAQDALFVGDLLAFQARLLARAPRRDLALLIGGLAALEAELAWFEAHAGQQGVALYAERHPTTAAYQAFLAGLESGPYAAGLVALWALERAYLEAWRGAAPGHPDYRPSVEHWTAPAFAAYVDGLEQAAEAALAAGASGRAAEAAFLEVARLERAFWAMAWVGGVAP